MSTVTRPDRARLLEAMLEELAEKGYPEVEIEAAAARAQLGRAEWSNEFPDVDSCLLAAFDELGEQLRAEIVAGCLTAEDWPDRVAAGLRALLARLSRQAAATEAIARAFPAIGPGAAARYHGFVEGLAPLLAEGRRCAELGEELPLEVELLAVGAVESIVFEQIQLGRTPQLPQLAPELLFSLLVPFLGPDDARRAMEAERQRAAASPPPA